MLFLSEFINMSKNCRDAVLNRSSVLYLVTSRRFWMGRRDGKKWLMHQLHICCGRACQRMLPMLLWTQHLWACRKIRRSWKSTLRSCVTGSGKAPSWLKVWVLDYCFVSVAHWHSARWAWNGYQPGLGSIPRPGRINCLRITGVHALRLISRTGKRVWRCPL